jgi:hypothetical protein
MTASDPTELLARLASVSDDEAAEVFGAGKAHLFSAITQLPQGRSRPALRRPLVIAVAALVVFAATGAAWALTRGSARETTAVDCRIGGGTTVIDATSGNPATDCAAIWPAPVPKLQAYDNGIGGIAVIPASETAPAGWTAIESQDVALIVLQESLDDNVNGLDSACFSSARATTFAQQQLDRLGLVGWTTAVRPAAQQPNTPAPVGTKSAPTTAGPADCYGGYADPTTKTVTLMAMGDQSGAATWPPHKLADSLRPLTQECLSLSAMENEVVQRATALGMSQTVENASNYQLKTVKDDTMRCATVTESVTGTAYVIVRGPVHAP